MTVKEIKAKLKTRKYLRDKLDKTYIKYYDSSESEEIKTQNLKEFEKLKKQVDELNKWYIGFIDSIDDDYIKYLIQLRYSKGFSWDKISLIMGGCATSDCYRLAVDRYIRKISK